MRTSLKTVLIATYRESGKVRERREKTLSSMQYKKTVGAKNENEKKRLAGRLLSAPWGKTIACKMLCR